MTRPVSSWKIWSENTGKVSAKYPVVEILFHETFFSEHAFPGWKATHHANAPGWYGFQWSPDHSQVVHPGFPIELPTMDFSKKVVGKNMAIVVTTVADGVGRKTIKIPVKFDFLILPNNKNGSECTNV
ncbi:MAG: hypothetical protein JWN30_469 [Bacilli bacterium]|nr:hypothetical protein [Bacilli bacterium]